MNDILLIVFLGNPGREYATTRHNAGFMLAEHLPEVAEANWQRKFDGMYAQVFLGGAKRMLLKPETFMNRSGKSVQKATSFFRFEPERILIVHDDLELPFGAVGVKQGGGLGGHNGLRSVSDSLGTREFCRFRIGISRPVHGNVSSYVLSRFSADEEARLPDFFSSAAHLLIKALEAGPEQAAKLYGRRSML